MGISWNIPTESTETATTNPDVAVTDPTPTTINPNSPRGQKVIDQVLNSYTNAISMDDTATRTIMIDALNEKFRSKSFRQYVADLRGNNEISDIDFRNMQAEIVRHRYAVRTPHAKAFRSQWP